MPTHRIAKAQVQTFLCYTNVSISAGVLIGNASTNTYLESTKPNIGS